MRHLIGPASFRVMPFYFAYFGANAIYLGFFTVHLSDLGLSGSEIGAIMALAPLASLAGQPLWSAVGDRLRLRNTVLALLAPGAAICMYLCGLCTAVLPICLFHCAYALFYYAIQPVGDAVTLDVLGREHLPYGPIRVAGVLGYSLVASLSGVLIGAHTERVTPILALLLASILLASKLMPSSPSTPRRQGQGGMGRVLRRPGLAVLLLYGGLAMVSLTFYYNYYSIYFLEAGGSKTLLGFSHVLSALSEIPFLLIGDKVLHRFGGGKVLLWGGGIMALRWLLISLFPVVPVLMGTQLLHFACFAAMTITIIEYVDHVMPEEQKVSGQLLFSVFIISSAKCIGSLVGGVVADLFTYRTMYLLSALFMGACLLVFSLYQRTARERYAFSPDRP